MMARARRRWPKRIVIPETVIEVQMVSKERMRDEAADHDEPAAMWDDGLYVIHIQKSMTRSDQWEELFHEGHHAGLDVVRRAILKAIGTPVAD